MRDFLKYGIFIVPIFLAMSGGWLLFTPWLWTNGGSGSHDLVVNISIDPAWNLGCLVTNTHVQWSCKSINATIGTSVVKSNGESWVPSNEIVDAKWVQVTVFCARASSLVMITVKDGHLMQSNGQM